MRCSALLFASLCLSACAAQSSSPNGSSPAGLGSLTAGFGSLPATRVVSPFKKSSKIQHVVVIVQENRSFDDLFQGFPGANTVPIGKNSQGQSVALQPEPLEANYGIDHSLSDYIAACDGSPPGRNCKMDGFDREGTYGMKIPQNAQYGYVPHTETQLYFAIGEAYVVGDNMFTSSLDESFVSHQYLIAAQANHAVNLPSGPWGCGGGPSDTVPTLTKKRTLGPPETACFDYPTIGDELDAKGLSWRYYAPPSTDASYIWSAYQAVNHIYNGPDWTSDVISPPQQFLSDVQSGQLANVTWIAPYCANSDHATCLSNTGPQWVASLVDAVGESPFWNTTTIFVMWDEWGGWYDHVAPPYVDYDGLGVRVPLMIVSPYAKAGYVSHVQYEHGSILKYIEDTFGLHRLSKSDKRANSPVPDAIDYTQQPRTFTPFASQSLERQFLRQRPDPRPLDEN